MFALCLAIYLIIIIFDFIPIAKKGNKKITSVYLIIILISFTLTILHDLGIELPSPMTPITSIIKKVTGV